MSRKLSINLSAQSAKNLDSLRQMSGLRSHMLISYMLEMLQSNPAPLLRYINGRTYVVAGRTMTVDTSDTLEQLALHGLDDQHMKGYFENLSSSLGYSTGPDAAQYQQYNNFFRADLKDSKDPFKVYCRICGAVGTATIEGNAKGMMTKHVNRTGHADSTFYEEEREKGAFAVVFFSPADAEENNNKKNEEKKRRKKVVVYPPVAIASELSEPKPSEP